MTPFETLKSHGLTLFPLTTEGIPAASKWFDCDYPAAKLEGGRAAINCSGLLVLDVDNKNGKDGSGSLAMLELDNEELPCTLTQMTPSGGFHYIFKLPEGTPPTKNSVGRIGEGLDVRGWHGYVVAAGSSTSKGTYSLCDAPIALAPSWLIALCAPQERERVTEAVEADQTIARERAIGYLNTYPGPVAGERAHHMFVLGAKMKDIGIADPEAAYDLIHRYWASRGPDRCDDTPEKNLEHVIGGYTRSNDAPGSSSYEKVTAAAQASFDVIPGAKTTEKLAPPAAAEDPDADPDASFNIVGSLFDMVKIGTTGVLVERETGSLIGWDSAPRLLSPKYGKGPVKEMMEHFKFQAYPEGFTFQPGVEDTGGAYNTWRGFSVTPKTGPSAAVDRWLENLVQNACRGDQDLAGWLLSWCAHLFQSPERKSAVAAVLKGRKGVGKNRLVEPLVGILGRHAVLADDSRYLTGNFNSHLQSNLLLVLDEAAWAGDKSAEGRLKGIITGSHHLIEQKGFEPYSVPNLSRICIIGNDEWLVPASADERRYAVFEFATAHQQDRAWFEPIAEGIERSEEGKALLLGYLLNYKIQHDVNVAPVTPALIKQKLNSLGIAEHYWLYLLRTMDGDGYFTAGQPVFGGPVSGKALHEAFIAYSKRRAAARWLPDLTDFLDVVKGCCPSANIEGLTTVVLPDIVQARNEFDRYIGGALEWPDNLLNLL